MWTKIAVYYNNKRVGDIPARVVAEQRAVYYANLDSAKFTEPTKTEVYHTIYESELNDALIDRHILLDWTENNTDWTDVGEHFYGPEWVLSENWDDLEFKLEAE